MVILLKIDTRNVEKLLTKYQRTIPAAADIGARKLASFAADTYALQAERAGIESWRGVFYGTFAKQSARPIKVKGGYIVSVAPMRRRTKDNVNYAIALDRMKTHFVPFRKGGIITQWANKKLGLKAKLLRGITVKKHPYINKANRIISKNSKPIVQHEVNKAIRRK